MNEGVYEKRRKKKAEKKRIEKIVNENEGDMVWDSEKS